jgi:hypothetical protein
LFWNFSFWKKRETRTRTRTTKTICCFLYEQYFDRKGEKKGSRLSLSLEKEIGSQLSDKYIDAAVVAVAVVVGGQSELVKERLGFDSVHQQQRREQER